MHKLFNCSNSLNLYHCNTSGWSTSSKVSFFIHKNRGKIKSEVIYEKQLCDECSVISSHSLFWIFSSQMKHDKLQHQNKRKRTSKNLLGKNTKLQYEQCDIGGLQGQMPHVNIERKQDNKAYWYICEHCNYKTKSKKTLQIHCDALHSANTQKYQCSQCGFHTSTHGSMLIHKVLEKHSQRYITWHYCKNCSFRAKDRRLLRQHCKTMHSSTNVRVWFSCNICEFKARNNALLQDHVIESHVTEKQKYKCGQCPFEAHLIENLRRHVNFKHTPDHLTKWFNCKFCSFKTNLQENLSKHVQTKHQNK